VRLHGRNYENWFREKAVRDERYNYLYSIDELEPWIARIREVATESAETYVITNNHFRGQAVRECSGDQIDPLAEQRVPAPEPLFSSIHVYSNQQYPKGRMLHGANAALV